MPGSKVLLSGASGLIGTALTRQLLADGMKVQRLVRDSAKADEERFILWQPERGIANPGSVEGIDAVVHLAGANIADGRWTARRKKELTDSRVLATKRLVESLSSLESPPKTFLCASGVGYYGPDRFEPAAEDAPAGEGFLARLCVDWEDAAEDASAIGCRVIKSRFSVVLSNNGGALEKMLLPFKLGVGGRLGSGRQYFSWVSENDAVRALRFLLDSALHGPFNITAPEAVTNEEFTRCLARTLKRPALIPVPAAALKLALGQLAEEALLGSNHAVPAALSNAGFEFSDPTLSGALANILEKP